MTDMILSDGKQLSMQDYIMDIIATNGKNLPKTLAEFKPQFDQVKVLSRTAIAFALASGKIEVVAETQKANTEAAQSLSIADIIMTQHLGKLTSKMSTVDGNDVRNGRADAEEGKQAKLKEAGIKIQEASDAERIDRNPDVVEKLAPQIGEVHSA